MTTTLVLVCHNCGGYLLAKSDQKTRTCPYCGSAVNVEKARKLGSANTSREASALLQRIKQEAAERR